MNAQMVYMNYNDKGVVYPGYQYYKSPDKHLVLRGSNSSNVNCPIVKDSLERLNLDIEKFNNSHKVVNLQNIERLNKLARSGSELKNTKELMKYVDKRDIMGRTNLKEDILNSIQPHWMKDSKYFGDKEFLKHYYINIFENIYSNSLTNNKQQNFIISPLVGKIKPDEKKQVEVRNIEIIADGDNQENRLIKKNSNKAEAKPSFSSIYNSKKYKYIITPGNNSNIIREAMKQRKWWVEIPNFNNVFNFKWQPTSCRLKFKELGRRKESRQIVNHLEFHRNISEK